MPGRARPTARTSTGWRPRSATSALKALEQGKAELGDFDGKPFFEALLQITMEGFFADPIYGGNRNKVALEDGRLPGLPAVYANLIEDIATSATSPNRSRSQISREGRRDMATRLKEVDAVMVGMGWTGSIMARELTKAGLNVVGLERGEDITPREHFALPNVRDELKYSQRLELIQDPALETVTFRHRPSETALPMRRMGSFLPGNTVGGAANHWGGLHWRYHPTDHLSPQPHR